MKRILLVTVMVFAAIFIISCSGDEGAPSNEAGASCQNEGEETCSQDYSQILICQDSSWQAKKACKLNFGQYCRQTAGGAFSCTDSGDSGNSTEPTTDPTDSTDDETTDSTDTEPNDTDPTNQEPEDNEPVDDSEDPVDDTDEPTDTDNEPEEPVVQDIETCADIFECMAQCTDTACKTQCSKRGITDAQNDYYSWSQCKVDHNYNIAEILKDEDCKALMVACGQVGDSTYGIPYGHAIVQTSIPYLYSADTESIAFANSATNFITGTFGNSGNIVDPSSIQGTFAYAILDSFTDTHENFVLLVQNYKDDITYNPIARMIITATEPGTYTVGLGHNDKARLFISETNGSQITCDHAFGFGSITISAISYSLGATTIAIDQSEIELYSYKNAPMYDDR